MSTPDAVDPSNDAQLGAWDGDTGAFWTEYADHFDAGVAAYRPHLLEALAVEPADAVLDVGCGSGQISRDAALRAVDGSVLGVDLSARQLDLARRRAVAEGLPHVTFRQADAQVHPFVAGGTDLVVSRHGSMFFGDPAAAFANLARTLRPGGRLVLLVWQPLARQEWLRSFFAALDAGRDLPGPPADGPSPVSLGDPVKVRTLLTGAGFVDVELDGLDEPMFFGTGTEDAFRFVSAQQAGLVRDLDPETRAHALDALRADLEAHRTTRGVFYDSATWLVRARRG